MRLRSPSVRFFFLTEMGLSWAMVRGPTSPVALERMKMQGHWLSQKEGSPVRRAKVINRRKRRKPLVPHLAMFQARLIFWEPCFTWWPYADSGVRNELFRNCG